MSSNLNAIRLDFEAQRSLAAAGIGAAYAAVGGALAHPAFQFKIDNQTDALLQFSIDGVTDHFVLNSGQSWINDCNTNRSGESKAFVLPVGTILYVKDIGASTTGSVYFTVIYADSGY